MHLSPEPYVAGAGKGASSSLRVQNMRDDHGGQICWVPSLEFTVHIL